MIMKTMITLPKFVNLFIFTVFTCAIFAIGAAEVKANPGFGDLSRETRREINRARRATAHYHNINNALADGYMDINVFFPNMGYHYLKPAILDASFDPERPELLVYADFGNGHLRLVAVEYAVPTALTGTPPEGFTGHADVWTRNDDFQLWTLHAWIWYENPDGLFADFNPRVP